MRYVTAFLLAAWCSWATASDTTTLDGGRQQQAMETRAAAVKAMVSGPASVPLRDQAVLALPEHFGFIPQKEAAAFMQLMGNRTSDQFVGLVVPLATESGGHVGQWIISVQYDPAGYIKDDDAKHWDADKLLQRLKEGTEAANSDRESAGVAPIEVTRWVQPPTYEPGSHRLTWSAEAKRKDGTDADPAINYNTDVLGREGYFSLNLVTSETTVAQDKAAAAPLLAGVDFKSGKGYGDFNSSTDKIAAYGLAALVAGVAVKKLGLLALLAASIIKYAKIIMIAVAAFGVGITKWLKSRGGKSSST